MSKRDRSWIGRKFGTQEAVDAEVARLERIKERWERQRDSQAFESIEYWECHDWYVYYCQKIQALLP